MKAGEVVQLKSGGPDLTVLRETNISGYVEVAWFDGGTAKQDSFPEAALTYTKTQPTE